MRCVCLCVCVCVCMCVCMCVCVCLCVCVRLTERERDDSKICIFIFNFCRQATAPSTQLLCSDDLALFVERKKERKIKRKREREREIERKGNKEVNIHSPQPKCVFLQRVRLIVITVNVIIRLMLSLLEYPGRIDKTNCVLLQLL